jgi:hypothetical protein
MYTNLTKCAVLGATLFAGIALAQPANAACFESGIECTHDHYITTTVLEPLSCDSLWTVRNMIFDEKGYCFKTAKAQSVFSNDGCSYTTMASLPLNQYESANIQTVRAVEKQKACY